MYDELTIIERQKDSQFCELLNEVRCGEVSDKTVAILKERVISVSAVEKFNELVKAGQSPVIMLVLVIWGCLQFFIKCYSRSVRSAFAL